MIEKPVLAACKTAINSLLSQHVDGLMMNIPLDNEEAQMLYAACGNIPALFLDVSPTLGALRALSEHGLRVPADVSIISHDDTEDSVCLVPPLTTISMISESLEWPAENQRKTSAYSWN